ncbi:MAG: PA14 domain-containing protein, partial [Terrimicrobiaceae bacterium]
VPRDGVYTFYVTADDECRLSIDGKVLINQTGRKVPPDLGMTEHSGSLLLSKGLHRIDVQFVQMYAAFGLEVEWKGPGLTRQTIAPENLKH